MPHQQHLPARAEYALPEATPAGPAAPDGGSVAELESEEETAPTLATAPVEALPGAELAPALLALQGAAEADSTALSLLLALTRAGRLPQPASVAHRHPLAPQPLTAQQQRSLNNWLSDSHSHSFPTRGAALLASREGMVLASADEETRAQLLSAQRDVPLATAPMDMAAYAFKQGYLALAPTSDPGFAPPPPSSASLPPLDPGGLFRLHRESCDVCAAGSPCHGTAAVQLLSGVTFPWSGKPTTSGETKADLHGEPEIAPFDADVVAAVRKAEAIGALASCPRDAITHFSHAFVARASACALERSVEEKIDAGGEAGSLSAFAAAKALADTYVTEYERQLAAHAPEPGAASGGGAAQRSPAQRPKAADVLRAARAASDAATPGGKARLVVAMGDLSPHFVLLRCRYARSMEAMREVRAGWWACKVDAKAGYYQVPLHPSEWPYCGIAVAMDPEGTPGYFQWRRLPMGCGPSGFIFSLFSGMVHEAFQRRWGRTASAQAGVQMVSLCYLDDIIILCSSREGCAEALALLLQCMTEAGMTPNLEKSSPAPVGAGGAEHAIVLLGIRLDLRAMTLHLPAEKQVRTLYGALVLQHCAAASVPVPESLIAELGGRLIWWGNVDGLIPSHVRPLCAWLDGSKWANRWAAWRRAVCHWDSPKAQAQLAALRWFLARAASGRLQATALLSHSDRAVLVAAGDASGAANAVAVLLESALLRFHLADCQRLAVPVLEALALLLLIWRYRRQLANTTIVIGNDALGAAYWVVAGKARRDDANDICRLLRLACEAYDIVIAQKWLTRWWNLVPDHGADFPLASLAERGVPVPPIMVEVPVSGLPCDFLREWALELDPDFIFSDAWQAVNDRGAQ